MSAEPATLISDQLIISPAMTKAAEMWAERSQSASKELSFPRSAIAGGSPAPDLGYTGINVEKFQLFNWCRLEIAGNAGEQHPALWMGPASFLPAI